MNHIRIGIALFVLGILAIAAYYFALPLLEDLRQRATSDAGETRKELVVGMDNWVGYYPLCSNRMKRVLRDGGIRLQCDNDNANYPERMTRLRSGELDLAVATVDSYLLNGAPEKFPGTIVAVIDESKGGDAIIGRADLGGIDGLRETQGLQIAFTPGSPSEHLLKAIGTHFDIPELRNRSGSWRVETDGSEEALRQLQAGEVDVAVLWEPDVSRALARPGLTKVLGTEDTHRLIVDVLLASRELAGDDKQTLREVLSAYFKTLKYYRDNPDELRDEIAAANRVEANQADAMLAGVAWVNLHDNARVWYGVSGKDGLGHQGLVDSIDATLQILTDSGDFTSNPLPDQDPYRVIYSEPVEWLYNNGVFSTFGTQTPKAEADSLTRAFDALPDASWSQLREIGTLKVRPITFQSGTAQLTLDGKKELDKAANNLRHYPNFRMVIEGHTGSRGDAAANLELSEERAEAVARYLGITYDVDENRVRAIGKGASEPLARRPGESSRAYNYRLPRVEIFLVAEVY